MKRKQTSQKTQTSISNLEKLFIQYISTLQTFLLNYTCWLTRKPKSLLNLEETGGVCPDLRLILRDLFDPQNFFSSTSTQAQENIDPLSSSTSYVLTLLKILKLHHCCSRVSLKQGAEGCILPVPLTMSSLIQS